MGVSAEISACEPIVTSIGTWVPDPYIEAEAGELSGGFVALGDTSASGGRYIEPPSGVISDDVPGEARARYTFRVPSAGSYLLWGRIHSPGALNNRFWVQVDGGTWYKWRISTGDVWYWDDVHNDVDYGQPLRFELTAGTHELLVANCVDGVRLDRFYITAAGDIPPGNDTPCSPPHSIELAGECSPSCGSVQGTTCGEEMCNGQEILPAYDCGVCCRIP